MPRSNFYVVVDTERVVGSPTTYEQLLKRGDVKYEGRDAKKANAWHRKLNPSPNKYDEQNTGLIYKSINGKEPMRPSHGFVIHKVSKY